MTTEPHAPPDPLNALRARSLEPGDAEALAALFDVSRTPCHCRWYDFHGDKNEWLDRCYNRPEENREELLRAVSTQSIDGVVALQGAEVVGWMRLSWSTELTKHYEQRIYRGLPCFEGDRSRVMAIGCFLVAPALRLQGVPRLLLQAGIARAEALGATQLEAFPHRATGLPREALFTGRFELLQELGFEVVSDFQPYPVLRYALHH
ncbi:MAG: GNAT family N-acetyltransferase [Polyangiaceae bacterium]|nr:GNAT family N-acetyltransferase [Polyangiaceae bacterium]MCW5791012.1 GNAT family N-acetyltransferase [Polyangiaceae bacterium]